MTAGEALLRAEIELLREQNTNLINENVRLHAERDALRAALRCERESGTCIMVHDPEREPCTAKNCRMMRTLEEARAALEQK